MSFLNLYMETPVMKSCETLEKMLKMSPDDRQKAGKVVARSFYKTLRNNGFTHGDIMDFAGHLLDGVIQEMEKEKERPGKRLTDTEEKKSSNETRQMV